MITDNKQMPSQQYSPNKRKSSTPIRRNLNQQMPWSCPSPYLQDNSQFIQSCSYSCDPRQYKLLLYIFSTNINIYYNKTYKGMLGELQDCYKVPLTKQQKYTAQNNIQAILQRNNNKLCRDILMRNSHIIKGINQYSQEYKRYKQLQINASLNIGENDNICENIANMTIQLTNQNNKDNITNKENIKNRLNSLSQSLTRPTQKTQQKQLFKKRPSTSNRSSCYHKSQQIQSYSNNNSNIFKNRNNNHHNQFTITNINSKTNMKTYAIHGEQYQYNINTENNSQFNGFVYIRQGSSRKIYKHKYKTNNTTNIQYNYNNNNNNNNNDDDQNIRILISQKVNNKMLFDYTQTNIINQNCNNKNDERNNNNSNNNNRYDKYDLHEILEMYQSDYENKYKYKWQSEKYIQHDNINNNSKYNNNNCNNKSNNRKNSIFCSYYNKEEKCYDKKNNCNRFFNQTDYTEVKSIDEQNLQKIQNRIMSIGGSLSTNTTKHQGYKPKSKCWGATLVSSGKLNAQTNKNGIFLNANINQNAKNIFSMMKYNKS